MKTENWKIIYENFFYYVEFYFYEPQPVGNASPTLLINGVERESEWLSDRKTLRAVISVAEIDRIKEVTTPGLYLRSLRKERKAVKKKPSKKIVDKRPRVTVPDSLSPGKLNVIRHDYDYGDDGLLLPGHTTAYEFRAAVYMPENAVGPHPLVIYIHGAHAACYDGESTEHSTWPCSIGFRPFPSHEGYGEAASALASQGYVVVSLSASGLMHTRESDIDYDDSVRRGHLILVHLELLAEANNGNRPELSFLKGRLDLQNIGLMGHSRGGEGVARVITLNRLLDKGYGIRAALLLGSTAVEDIAIPDTHTAVILPFFDGDVTDLTGQKTSDLSRYAFNDNVLRSSVLMLGANHNFFNSTWSPGFVGGGDDGSMWSGSEVVRLTQEEQRLLGSFYMAGFFRLTLGGEQAFLALFDGSRVSIPVLPTAEIRSSAHFPASSRYVVQSFETLYSDEASLMPGNWTWNIMQGIGEIKTKASFGRAPSGVRYTHNKFHSFLNLKGVTRLSPAQLELHSREGDEPVDISIYTHLNFHVAHLLDENSEEAVELHLTLGEGTIDLSETLSTLWPIPEIIPGVGTFLQQHISVPLADFPIDISRPVNSMLFTLPTGGNIYLSDIVFVKPSLGDIRSIQLPFVSLMEDTHVVVTGAEQELEIEAFLSEASSVRVAMRVDFWIYHRIRGRMDFSARMEFEPGEQSKTVSFIIPAGGFTTDTGGRDHYIAHIYMSALSNALFDRHITRFRITPFP